MPRRCLNVYDPAQWSAIRWLSALYLAFLSSLPVTLHHITALQTGSIFKLSIGKVDVQAQIIIHRVAGFSSVTMPPSLPCCSAMYENYGWA